MTASFPTCLITLLFAIAIQCDDWQLSKKTLLQRNTHMFNNTLMSDIMFTCTESNKKFYAHKYVLATNSPVFFTTFYGHSAEENSVIHLRDTDEDSLKEFLRFLYTDQCALTPDNAARVMYLAKQFIVPSLTEKCVEVLQNSINPENVVTVLEQAIHFEEEELAKKCWEVVDRHTSETVSSKAFNDITQKTLTSLLKRDTLHIAEIALFQAALKWIDFQCSRNDLEASRENRRSVIGDAIYHIRFLSMRESEFAQHVSSSGLLTAEEMIPIYEAFNGFVSSTLKWKEARRFH